MRYFRWLAVGVVAAGAITLLIGGVAGANPTGDTYVWQDDGTIKAEPSGLVYRFTGGRAMGPAGPAIPDHYAAVNDGGKLAANPNLARRLQNFNNEKTAATAIIAENCHKSAVTGHQSCSEKEVKVTLSWTSQEQEKNVEHQAHLAAGAVLKDEESLQQFKNDPAARAHWCKNGPFGGGECSDIVWQEILGKCAIEARSKWADAARYNPGLAEGEAAAQSRRQFFANCLSQRLYKNSSKAGVIVNAIKEIDPLTAAEAGSAAAKKERENIATKKEAEQQKNAVQQEEPSCENSGAWVGWILCGGIRAVTGFADVSWGLFEWLLRTQPLLSYDGQGQPTPIFQTWQRLRDIANALLVVFFLYVIFSQVTSTGLSNYGIKKTLPRIILVAVAINLSFFLVQIMFDISNILGLTLDDLISNKAVVKPEWSALLADLAAAGLTIAGTGAAGGILALMTGPSVFIFLAMMLIPAAIAMLAGLVALIVRLGLVSVLGVLAPVALVAYVLPNTQGLFDRWKKLFFSMLFLYPVAAFSFGALKFTANMFLQDQTAGATLQRLVGFLLLMFGGGVICWVALKSNAITGKITGAAQGFIDKVGNPLQKMGRSYAGAVAKERFGAFKNRDHSSKKGWGNIGFLGRKKAIRATGRIMSRFDESKRRRDLRTQLYDQAYNEGITGRLTSNPDELVPESIRGTAVAQSFVSKIVEDQIGAETTRQASMPVSTVLQIAKDTQTSQAARVAAVRRVVKEGSSGEVMQLVQMSQQFGAGSLENQALSAGVFSRGFHGVLGSGVGEKIIQGQIGSAEDINKQIVSAIKKGISAEGLAKDGELTNRVADIVNTRMDQFSTDELANLGQAADRVLSNPALSSTVKGTAVEQNLTALQGLKK